MDPTKLLELLGQVTQRPGFISSFEKRIALANMARCKTLDCGGREMYCPQCKSVSIVFNPCNQRGCPTCYEKNQILWKIKLQRRLIPVSHEHITFSFPQILTQYWLRDSSRTISVLFKVVSKAVKELEKKTGLLYGTVLVFQSHGKSMAYKPHIHCLMTSGGMNTKHIWQDANSICFSVLEEAVAKMLPIEIAKEYGQEEVLEFKTKRVKNECRVYHAHHEGSGNSIVEYLSHSLAGVVVNVKQEIEVNDKEDIITYTEKKLGNTSMVRLGVETFVERYINHIPPKACVTIRYLGLYSNRYVQEKKDIIRTITGNDVEEYFEIVIAELCPKCHSVLETISTFAAGDTSRLSVRLLQRAPPRR